MTHDTAIGYICSRMTSPSYVKFRRRVFQMTIVVVSVFLISAIYMSSEWTFGNRIYLRVVGLANVSSSQYRRGTTTEKVPPAFLRGLSDVDAANLNDILRRFTETADKAKLTYIMYWGTLIGAFRHHGRVPWDDEVDLLLPNAQKKRLLAAMAPLAPRYSIVKSAIYRWKFFASNSTAIKHYKWKFPFIDLSFYYENDTSLWDLDPGFRRRNTYRKSDVFPLCRRPFSPFMLPAPRNTRVFLKQQFDIEDCVSSSWSHSAESRIAKARQVTKPCNKLWGVLPFVFRTRTSHGTNETLKIGSRIIDWKLITGCVNVS